MTKEITIATIFVFRFHWNVLSGEYRKKEVDIKMMLPKWHLWSHSNKELQGLASKLIEFGIFRESPTDWISSSTLDTWMVLLETTSTTGSSSLKETQPLTRLSFGSLEDQDVLDLWLCSLSSDRSIQTQMARLFSRTSTPGTKLPMFFSSSLQEELDSLSRTQAWTTILFGMIRE